MNNRPGRSDLKVDALCVPLNENNPRSDYIIIYNINIPIRYFFDPTEATRVLQRVNVLISGDFFNVPASFQITASYQLRHTTTGELRIWTGSFNARNNAPAQLSGFELFDHTTFVQTSLEHIEDLEERLTLFEETKWVLHQVISIIFNVQSKVKFNHGTIGEFPNAGRRSHRTFAI